MRPIKNPLQKLRQAHSDERRESDSAKTGETHSSDSDTRKCQKNHFLNKKLKIAEQRISLDIKSGHTNEMVH